MHITVIGAANIDILTKSKSKIIPDGSNPADVSLTAGGTARNIAAMLALRGEDVSLITAVGNDPFGNLLRKSCSDIGINTDAWIVKNNTSTGVNLETFNSDGEPYAAFSAVSAPESIKTAEITKHKGLIKDTGLLILDLNLTEKILAVIFDLRERGPILVDSVSVDKIKRVEKFLNKIDVLKLNRLEAERLTGITLETKERVKQACFNILNSGVKRVFITLGMAGVCAADGRTAIFVPALPIAVKNKSGAGDAFSTGLALKIDKDLRTQAESGIALAAEHIGRKA